MSSSHNFQSLSSPLILFPPLFILELGLVSLKVGHGVLSYSSFQVGREALPRLPRPGCWYSQEVGGSVS